MVDIVQFSARSAGVMVIGLFLFGLMIPVVTPTWAEPDGREGQGTLAKISNPRTNQLRGIDWKDGTDEAYIVGEGAVYQYVDTTRNLTQLDGPESTDHYYEDIAWRPKGDYAIIVGATPRSSKAKGLISKMWLDGTVWRISALSTTVKTRLTGIAWAPDSSYAVLVGGARSGEAEAVGAIMLRLSGTTNNVEEIYSDTGPSGLSDVEYNTHDGKFYAVGLDGKMMTYDGDRYTIITDNKLKSSNMFSLTWRDNGGRAMMGGWFGSTLKGHILTTDGGFNRVITETSKYINDADWAPRSDHTLFVGQTGAIWEYSGKDGLTQVDNTLDSKYYYGVDFNDDGSSALVVGKDGIILQYNVSYPAQENYPPSINMVSPQDKTSFDYGVEMVFDSNGTHDDDLDELDFEWTSSIDDHISDDPYFTTTTMTPGRHTITLTVDDANGHKVSTSINITIRAPTDPPRVDAGEDPIGYVGVDLPLNGKVIFAEFDIESYEWDYEGTGDFYGTMSPKGEYRYTSTGVYNASFRVTDVRKAVGEDTVTATIFPKRTDADDLVTVGPDTVFQTGDAVIVKVNLSCSKKVEVQLVGPNGRVFNVPPTAEQGTYQLTLPKNLKKGNYDVQWRYYDHRNNKTEWYEKEDAFLLKVPEKNGNGLGAAVPYIATGIGIVIIIIVIFFVVRVLYQRSITSLDVSVLMYRDGRFMYSYSPPRSGKEASPVSPDVIGKVQAAVQGQIYNIQQGTQERLPGQINLGDHIVLIESGVNTLIAVAYTGPEPENIKKNMKSILQEIEILYGNQLRQWDGTVTTMPALQSTMAKYVRNES